MEVFVTVDDGWRPQTNNTSKTFILDVAMVLDMSCETITKIDLFNSYDLNMSVFLECAKMYFYTLFLKSPQGNI